MIGTDAICRHSNGHLLKGCFKLPEFSCEEYCTNQPLCIGYLYHASTGQCVLFPKKPTDGSVEICPPGFRTTNGPHAETVNDIVPGDQQGPGMKCYGKISGNNIVEFEV